MPSENGFCPISSYENIDFYSWTAFDSAQAAQNGLILPSDADCAISSPNALFSWRSQTPSLWPRFVLNETTAADRGIDKYFDLLGLAIKPMNYTARLTRVYIHAYGIDFNVTTSMPHNIASEYWLVTLNLRDGPWRQAYKDIVRIFPKWGKGVNMVEMYGVSPEGEDVPLCIDDLRVEFHEEGYYNEKLGGQSVDTCESISALNWDHVELEDEAMIMSARGCASFGQGPF